MYSIWGSREIFEGMLPNLIQMILVGCRCVFQGHYTFINAVNIKTASEYVSQNSLCTCEVEDYKNCQRGSVKAKNQTHVTKQADMNDHQQT